MGSVEQYQKQRAHKMLQRQITINILTISYFSEELNGRKKETKREKEYEMKKEKKNIRK